MGKYVDMKGKTQIRTKAFDGVFVWSPTAEPRWDGRFALAQKAVDSAVLRFSDPYMPKETGTPQAVHGRRRAKRKFRRKKVCVTMRTANGASSGLNG